MEIALWPQNGLICKCCIFLAPLELIEEKKTFFFSFIRDTRSAVFPQGRATEPSRGGSNDSLSLLMEKVHNVSSVHQLTLEASQWRTKPSQSGYPTWVFGLSSGFIKSHKGHIRAVSPIKTAGPWALHQEAVWVTPVLDMKAKEQQGVQKAETGSNRWKSST